MHSHRTQIIFAKEIWLLYAAAFLFLPFRWILGWGIAVFVHEVSHYFALRYFKCDIHSIYIGCGGVRMETSPLSAKEEILCAIAGPIGGLLPVTIIRFLPAAGVSAILLSTYNLLPYYPMDGGRVVHIWLKRIVKQGRIEWIIRCIQWMPIILLFGSALLLKDIRICVLILPIVFHVLQVRREKDLAKRSD